MKDQDYAFVHRYHVGATEQRAAAARVMGFYMGTGDAWDAADAVVEAWLSKAPPLDARIMRALTGTPDEHGGE